MARISARLTPRCVAGIRAAASAPKAALTPGRKRNGTPSRASARASSPPRAKSVGSPPFSRSTRAPPVARRTSKSLIAACSVDGPPAALADEMKLGAVGRAQRRRVDQRIVDHRVGLGERRDHLERQAAEPARPGPRQPDVARFELRQRRRQPRDRRLQPPAHGPARPRNRRW